VGFYHSACLDSDVYFPFLTRGCVWTLYGTVRPDVLLRFSHNAFRWTLLAADASTAQRRTVATNPALDRVKDAKIALDRKRKEMTECP
jgi:hypothetical protein